MARARATPDEPWEYVVGLLPHKVTAYEDRARKGVLYLKWRVQKEWARKSLSRPARDRSGKLDKNALAYAKLEADKQYDANVRGLSAAHTAPPRRLTIREGWLLSIDPEKGKWPVKTAHREEVRRSMERAIATWGGDTAWADIGRSEVRQLWRRELKAQRARGNAGVRSAETTVGRMFTVADWLRNEEHIGPLDCPRWSSWKKEFAVDAGEYEPKRPRYTGDEYRAFLAATVHIDPRWHLLIQLGAELRIGQVVRTHRRDLNLERGHMRIRGLGNKRGALLVFTPGQAALMRETMERGYLAGLERAFVQGAIEDYPLFPGWRLPVVNGQLVTTAKHATRPPLDESPLRDWFLATEDRARVVKPDGTEGPITHVPGRGWKALRRTAVDEAKRLGISREGMQAQGGWKTSQVPNEIYADQEQQYASEEAARVRAIMRGESVPANATTTDQNGTRPADERAVPENIDHVK